MSSILCSDCGDRFDGRETAVCPTCQAARWARTKRLIREKHDPDVSGLQMDTYRSILTPRAKQELRAVLDHAAREGRWYHDRDYRMWVHVSELPLGRAPGVGIPAGREAAEHALDCLFIAEANDLEEAHVFAVDRERHEAQVRAGVFEPLGGCQVPGCDNLAIPARPHCHIHREPEAGARCL